MDPNVAQKFCDSSEFHMHDSGTHRLAVLLRCLPGEAQICLVGHTYIEIGCIWSLNCILASIDCTHT